MDIGRPSYCPLHGDYGRGEEYERRNCPGCRNKASPTMEPYVSARKARLARIDATAREYAVAASGRNTTWIYYEARKDEPSRLVVEPAFFKAAYEFALALERARDEAVKEIQ